MGTEGGEPGDEPSVAAGVDRDAGPMTRSSRDAGALRGALEAFLREQLPGDADAQVRGIAPTSTTGMSSETLLLDASWCIDGERQDVPLVARLAPAAGDVPVFPAYDMRAQFDLLRQVAAHSAVPVPSVRWCAGAEVLGTPFFVMDRVEGRVPPDVMPYTFGDNWLFDADAAEQRHLQDATVRVLAELHAVPEPAARFEFLGAAGMAAKLERTQRWYEWVVAGADRSPLIDEALAWLHAHAPADDAARDVVSWGDSRIGNVLYDGFEPVAVLDWEMACVGPPELDVAWLVYSHRVFQDLAEMLELPGMPSFLGADDVVATYEATSGRRLGDLRPGLVIAAVQWGIVFLRTTQRAVHFGERQAPAHVDEPIMNASSLRALLDGTNGGTRG